MVLIQRHWHCGSRGSPHSCAACQSCPQTLEAASPWSTNTEIRCLFASQRKHVLQQATFSQNGLCTKRTDAPVGVSGQSVTGPGGTMSLSRGLSKRFELKTKSASGAQCTERSSESRHHHQAVATNDVDGNNHRRVSMHSSCSGALSSWAPVTVDPATRHARIYGCKRWTKHAPPSLQQSLNGPVQIIVP